MATQLEYVFEVEETVLHKCRIVIDVEDPDAEGLNDDAAWEEMESRFKQPFWRETIIETDNEWDEPEIIAVLDCIEILDDDDEDTTT